MSRHLSNHHHYHHHHNIITQLPVTTTMMVSIVSSLVSVQKLVICIAFLVSDVHNEDAIGIFWFQFFFFVLLVFVSPRRFVD